MVNKKSCSLCARRKVKCDKANPCSNCVKAQVDCVFKETAPYRPRKRAADDKLLTRLAHYEDLMRKNNIDYSRYANAWVPSRLEMKPKEDGSPEQACLELSTVDMDPKAFAPHSGSTEKCFWSDLCPELKHPPIHILRHKEDPVFHPAPSLQSIVSSNQPSLHELHPEPRQIYRLWQIFVESVNPLIKIVHVPSLQQRVLDASWNMTGTSRSMTAILFAIYTLAIISITSEDCQTTFGEPRNALLARYRNATLRALMAAEFLTTRDLEVMQAFVLFLLADPESDLSSTLTGAAMRVAQKMGLHKENAGSGITFFEVEMRIRLWWQLCRLYARVPAIAVSTKAALSEVGHVRLPLNVNDSDLHPEMLEAPMEHKGPTEMMCVLLKYEVTNWLRSSPTATKVFENIVRGPAREVTSRNLEEQAINELEAIYENKFLQYADKRIPLHAMTHAIAKLSIARMRFKVYHPCSKMSSHQGEVYMTSEESGILFTAAITMLEMVDLGTRSKFSSHLFTDMTSKFQMDAYIYVISDLRKRCSGDQVNLAWRLVEELYNEYKEQLEDAEHNFLVVLEELILEAWGARSKDLVRQGVWNSDSIPHFITSLRRKRQNESIEITSHSPLLMSDPATMDLEKFHSDWEYWSDFLRI